MIVRDRLDGLTLIAQHDHAVLAGELAARWALPPASPELQLATRLHDVAWIPLDNAPLWNDVADRPYTFQDYPEGPKVEAYTRGLKWMAGLDPHVGLLGSLHYSSFFEEGHPFQEAERKRQERLSRRLAEDRLAGLDEELALLQLWDALSLYVCLNEPGTPKEQEHPWYRHGFPPTRLGEGEGEVSLQARWLDTERIALRPFPLPTPLATSLVFRHVARSEIAEAGWPRAYREAVPQVQLIRFVR